MRDARQRRALSGAGRADGAGLRRGTPHPKPQPQTLALNATLARTPTPTLTFILTVTITRPKPKPEPEPEPTPNQVRSTQKAVVYMMVLLLGQLWFTCVLSKTYMEMVQDHLNDSDDHSLIDFIWERRRATRIEALGPSLSLSLFLSLALALALAPTLAPALPLAPALALALALTLWSHTLPAACYPGARHGYSCDASRTWCRGSSRSCAARWSTGTARSAT